MTFRVELDLFRGPLDLLLFLVRKHELDVAEVPLAEIAGQFLDYLEVLKELDFDLAADFLEIASLLVELKARSVLPTPESDEPVLEEPQQDLVERLLEYKRYKDAASMLQEQARQWQQCYPRLANDAPPRRSDLADQPIAEVELWDLVSAFGRIIRDSKLVQEPPSIVYDETPLHVYMEQIHQQLAQCERVPFHSVFHAGMHKSALIGLFLALLELVRHHDVFVEQEDLHGEIHILRGDRFDPELKLADLDTSSADEPTSDSETERTHPGKPR